MGGTPVDEVRIDRRGVHADRLWAVRDLERDITASARKLPALLGCSARFAIEPGPDAGPGNAPEVVITMPDGTELSSADNELDRALSDLLGREVRLTALPPREDTSLHRLSVRQTRAGYSPAESATTWSCPTRSRYRTRRWSHPNRCSPWPGTPRRRELSWI